MQQAAYDLRVFEERPARQPKPELRVRRGAAKTQYSFFAVFRSMAVGLVIVSLACAVLYSHSQLTVLSAKITKAQEDLQSAQSEYDYMTLQLESKTDLTAVENYALTELGLSKMTQDQITYLNMESEDKVVKTDDGAGSWFRTLTSAFLDLKEYFLP